MIHRRITKAAAAVLIGLSTCFTPEAKAEGLLDLCDVVGVRDNQLVGYGVVTGLNGTGDDVIAAPFAAQSLRALLRRLGVQIPAQQLRYVGFGIDLLFELAAVVQAHELVSIAGVAVTAAEFAAAIGIDRPLKRHTRFRAVEDAACGELEVFNFPLGFQQIALSGHFRDADEHASMFALSSPVVKWTS